MQSRVESVARALRHVLWTDALPLPFTIVSGLSRARVLCRFMTTGLACEGIKRRANNGHPNSTSGRKVQQKIVVYVRAAAEIASKHKHSPERELLNVASKIVPPDLVLGRACWSSDSGPADSDPAETSLPDTDKAGQLEGHFSQLHTVTLGGGGGGGLSGGVIPCCKHILADFVPHIPGIEDILGTFLSYCPMVLQNPTLVHIVSVFP
jgi:hypothetical protein